VAARCSTVAPTVPAVPTLRDLRDAATAALGRDLREEEQRNLLEGYTYHDTLPRSINAAETDIQPHFFTERWYDWLTLSSGNAGAAAALQATLQEEGAVQNQKSLYAKLNDIPTTALDGFHCELQHQLFVRAWLSLDESKIPSDGALQKAYALELSREKDRRILDGEIIDGGEAFLEQMSVAPHLITRYKNAFKPKATLQTFGTQLICLLW
jgi:hypothetical protein